LEIFEQFTSSGQLSALNFENKTAILHFVAIVDTVYRYFLSYPCISMTNKLNYTFSLQLAVRCKKSSSKIEFIAEGNRNKCSNTNYLLE
jgi:hypothetical protein